MIEINVSRKIDDSLSIKPLLVNATLCYIRKLHLWQLKGYTLVIISLVIAVHVITFFQVTENFFLNRFLNIYYDSIPFVYMLCFLFVHGYGRTKLYWLHIYISCLGDYIFATATISYVKIFYVLVWPSSIWTAITCKPYCNIVCL